MYKALNEPFPPEMERTLTKSGTKLTYIPVSEVITRLNKVLGSSSWDFKINSCQRDAIDPDFIVAHVTLRVWFNLGTGGTNTVCERDGIGGQKIKRTRSGRLC
jgi:hypothetical protein